MSNRRRIRRGRSREDLLTPEGRKGVDEYTAAELHRFLVADAVRLHATTLPWAVAAYTRIGERERIGPEEAYRRVVAEVSALTGHGMPVQPNTAEIAMLRRP